VEQKTLRSSGQVFSRSKPDPDAGGDTALVAADPDPSLSSFLAVMVFGVVFVLDSVSESDESDLARPLRDEDIVEIINRENAI
jgi:hypothetical protein